jgi:hypothetical protein
VAPELAQGAIQDNFIYTDHGDSITIDDLVSNMWDGKIPAMIAGKPVTALGPDSMFNSSGFNEIVFPDSLKVIGARALAWTNVTTLKFPRGLTEIGDGAISGCRELIQVDLPAGLQRIGNEAFAGSDLESVRIPSATIQLGARVFQMCVRLEEAELPVGMRQLPPSLFEGCFRLKHVKLPSGLKTIGTAAFKQTGIKRLVVPPTVRDIGDEAFSGCSLLRDVSLPRSLRTIGASAFEYNPKLMTISVPPNVSSLGELAFDSCDMLASVRFEGNAPAVKRNPFGRTAASFMVFIEDGAKGFTAPKWMGKPVSGPRADIRVTDFSGRFVESGKHLRWFGSALAGKRGKTTGIGVWNLGNRPLANIAVTTSPDFRAAPLSGKALGVGKFLELRVTFTPKEIGKRRGSIQIRGTNNGAEPFEVRLIGFGIEMIF